jgi:hypothetical protein
MATNSKQLVMDFGFDSKGGSNVAGTLNVQGDFVTSGSFSFGGSVSSNLVPDTAGTRNLGNTSNRWTLFSNSINADGSLTVTNTASVGNTTITGFANASVSVNSAMFTVGTDFIANTSVILHTGRINAASFTTTGLLANVTAFVPTSNTILLGNTLGRFVLSANTGEFSGIVNSVSFTTSGLLANTTAFVPTSNTILLGNTLGRFVLSANTGNFSGAVTGTVANMSTSVNSALLTVGTDFIANTSGAYHTTVVNSASFTTTGLLANTTAFVPTSNTILLGNTLGRFVLSANTGNFSGTVTGTVANMSTSVNSALLTVGTNFVANSSQVTIGTGVLLSSNGTTGTAGHVLISNGATGSPYWATFTPTIPAAYVQNTDSRTLSGNLVISGTSFTPSSNTILLGNSIQRWVLSANTGDFTGTVTGTVANMSTSVNSALFTVGTDLIANASVILHTGRINAASFTTTGLLANVTAFVPTSNTILLGNTIGRFVLSANTGDFTGTVTGTIANMSTSVNSASLTVGSSFIANTSGVFHTATVNAASHTTTGFVANTTAIAPTSNTILLGNTIGRFVLSANTIDTSGIITGGAGATITGQVNASTGFGSGTIGAASNGLFANATTISIGNSSVNVAITPAGITSSGGTGINPSSNTVGTIFGTSTARWVVNANTGNFSGDTSIGGNVTISGTSHTVAGNVAFDTQVLFVDSVNNRVSINNTTPGVALEVSGSANVSTSVNSAMFTVGTSLIANASVILHTGRINAASFTTTGLVANVTAFVPTSNTILLGNSIGRFVLSANTGDFTGAVSGLSFSTSTLVANATAIAPTSNTILLGNTIGRFVLSANTGDFTGAVNATSFTATNLVANTSGVYHTGTVEAAIFNSTSDANSKYNIQTIEDPISKIMNMRGVTFTWKHSDKPSMGVIAQEVEPVIPEVVTTDANGKKSVSYDNIIGLLIEAIKNQQLQINSLINKAVRDGN